MFMQFKEKRVSRDRKGFTLSEIMLVLSVIGVIAALTIPGTIQTLNNKQYKVAYKKFYSVLSQATMNVADENGGTLKGMYSVNLIDAYGNYIGYLKKCAPAETYGNCWAKQGDFKYLNGSVITGWGGEPSIILRDGAFLFFGDTSGDCTKVSLGMQNCGMAWADINGFKPPNTLGRDIFLFHILDNTIKPVGAPGDSQDPAITCVEGTGSGFGCGSKYLIEP